MALLNAISLEIFQNKMNQNKMISTGTSLSLAEYLHIFKNINTYSAEA